MNQVKSHNEHPVFHYFEKIASIPHGSYHCGPISQYLVDFASEHGLDYILDDSYNVIIFKPASEGYESFAPVILQGHTDMVCEKEDGYDIDFEKDALCLNYEGEWLSAKGTTLGGDDGIAVAMMLAILADDTLKHPPIEAVFTSDEEVGMLGAEALDTSVLKGRRMINIDSEKEGVLTVGCGGGIDADVTFALQTEQIDAYPCRLTLSGLTGGHSGMEIDKERANAATLTGRILYELRSELPLRICSIQSGEKTNAIPRDCAVSLCIPAEAKDAESISVKVKSITEKIEKTLKHEYAVSDPELSLTLHFGEPNSSVSTKAADEKSTNTIISWLMTTPNGMLHKSTTLKDLVETSLNLGIMKSFEDHITFRYTIRSSVTSRKYHVCDRIRTLAEALGGTVEMSGDYPGWEYNKDSELLKICVKAFKEQYEKDPVIEATHAGLECGLFSGKLGTGFEAVSIGPDLESIHTTEERLNVPSAERVFTYVCSLLAALH